jgi:transposase-like protein
MVFQNLVSNPAFARVCGFNPNISNDYHLDAIPSLRKIEQFDLIMERYGIWSRAKYCEISDNIKNEVIEMAQSSKLIIRI